MKYPGSKWGISNWITSFFPEHHSYLEPYFGSGAVFFNKPRSNIETVNDLDGNVVNLFEWIRKDPERLAKAVRFLKQTLGGGRLDGAEVLRMSDAAGIKRADLNKAKRDIGVDSAVTGFGKNQR